jgi:hypothetical protein
VSADYRGARRTLYLALALMVIGAFVGVTWDQLWHATQPFDGFWSPPHVFVYVSVTLAAFAIMRLAFTPALRKAFGRGFPVIILPFRVPGALVILGGGVALLGFAGIVLDNLWHSRFGLNETAWSTPHAMIGWTLLLSALGFTACRLALRADRPLRWYTAVGFGLLVVVLSPAPFLGPLQGNRTPETVEIIARLPVMIAQPEAQHAFRIVQAWNLTRTNPALIALGALWAGAALGFLRRLDGRIWVVMLTVFLFGVMDSSRSWAETLNELNLINDSPAHWRELPLFLPALLALGLPRLRVPENWAWGLAGILFGLLVFSIWGEQGSGTWALALLGAPLMLLGKRIGERAYAIIEQPASFRAVLPLFVAAVVMPLLTGVIDLYIRSVTP